VFLLLTVITYTPNPQGAVVVVIVW